VNNDLMGRTNMNETKYKNLVGEKVRSLRRAADLSQEVLASRCGIFRTYLSRIESGAANPSLTVIVSLAEALGVEPHVLLQGTAAPNTAA
jgi:transcriptional regulator with XRE-family HTH domain